MLAASINRCGFVQFKLFAGWAQHQGSNARNEKMSEFPQAFDFLPHPVSPGHKC
jgi:hypothetical protein